MTDGERLVWSTSYAIVFDRGKDALEASLAAAHAVDKLRGAAQQRRATRGELTSFQIDERDFLDEIVSVP